MMLLMVLLFFGFLIGANVYLGARFNHFFDGSGSWRFIILFSVLTVFMMVATIGLINATSTIGSIVFGIAAIIMGFTLYLLIATIAVDILGLLFQIRPSIMGLSSILIAVLISMYGMWNATKIRLNEVDIEIEGIDKPIRAAHLTDTHLGHFRGGEKLKEIVDLINEQEVDVVFFTGDLLDSRIQLKPEAMNPLRKLEAPVFFVEGNHDEYTGVDAIKDHLRKIGVTVLENEMTMWKGIQVIGLTFMLADDTKVSPHAEANGVTIQNTLPQLGIDKELPSILLHHGPDGIQYANEHGVDLYLAGHTHGGQMWPATYVAKALFEYNRGLHEYGDSKVYVSLGTGTFGPPMRVGTYSELTILNLKPRF